MVYEENARDIKCKEDICGVVIYLLICYLSKYFSWYFQGFPVAPLTIQTQKIHRLFTLDMLLFIIFKLATDSDLRTGALPYVLN